MNLNYSKLVSKFLKLSIGSFKISYIELGVVPYFHLSSNFYNLCVSSLYMLIDDTFVVLLLIIFFLLIGLQWKTNYLKMLKVVHTKNTAN